MNRPDPLTPEERELARLLGRPASSAPPASVDDAVLAAARAAVQPTAVQPAAPLAAATSKRVPRRRSRLPAAVGLAASLVFAVGIAWQLKPEAPPPAAPVAVTPEAAADPGADAARSSSPAAEAPPPPPPVYAAAQEAVVASKPMPAPAAAPSPARAPAAVAPAPVPAPIPAPAPAPMAAPAALPAAPAPMAIPELREQDGNAAQAPALDSVQVTGSRAGDSRERARQGAPGIMRRAETAPASQGALSSSAAITAAVDADATLPRRQWIKRIRERRDAGDLDTARASLERYLQHYPEARIPGDLRLLLDP